MTRHPDSARKPLDRCAAPCAEAAGRRRPAAIAAAVLVAAAAVAAPAAAVDTAPEAVLGGTRVLNGIVAVVDGDPMTLYDLREYGRTGSPFLPPDVRGSFEALLQSMIERRLLRAEFEKNSVRADDSTVERYIENVLSESRQSRAQLDEALAKVSLSWEDYFERMREEVQRIALINLLIRSRVNVPDEEVERVWESDPEFVTPPKVTVGLIFLPVAADEDPAAALGRAQAVALEARRDFAAAAREHSQGPAAQEGGLLGDFERGSLAPHVEAALEGLAAGEVSEPVPGPGGYFLVQLAGLKSQDRRPYDDVKEELRAKIYDRRLQERYRKWADEDLRRDHRVDILLDDLALIAAGS